VGVRQLPPESTFTASDRNVLADFWYPVARSADIVTGPFPVMLLDEELVLYRAEGQLVAARDLCLHRGARLSLGWVEAGQLVCAYHGFRYGRDGACTRVPAQPGLPVPTKLCLFTVRCAERYGLVWVCLAHDSARTIPEWPEFANPEYRVVMMESLTWKCAAARHTENFNDLGHISWIHHNTFGDRNRPEVPLYEVQSRDYGLHAEVPYWQVNRRPSLGQSETHLPTPYTYDIFLPFFTRLHVGYTEGRARVLFDLAVPVSARVTSVFVLILQNRKLQETEAPADAIAYMQRLMDEDKRIVESQRPEQLPLDLSEEFHIRADRMSTHYRRALLGLGLGEGFSK
jgi:vanillate O-demethylase monooxygenase subunit